MAELYKRNGVWWFTAYYHEGSARKRVQRTTGIRVDGTTTGKRTAQRVAAEREAALVAGEGRRAREETLGQAVTKLVRGKLTAGRAHATVAITIEKLKPVLAYFTSDHRVALMTQADLDRYAEHALRTKMPGTVHRECRELVMALEGVGLHRLQIPEMGKIYKPRERVLNVDESRALLTAIRPERREHVLAYRHLGLRQSELGRIEAPDVDLLAPDVRVKGTKTAAADRRIPLTSEMRLVMARRCAERPVGPLFEPWGPSNALRELKAAAARAGLPPLSFNDLRRSFCTELILKNVPTLYVAHLMGHTTTRMVEDTYARVKSGKHMHDAIGMLAPLTEET